MPPVTGIAGLRGAKSIFKALGFPDLDELHGARDATITFNTLFNFDFDNSNGVDPASVDFETAAAHELGHALGFESEVDYVAWLIENGYEGVIRPKPLDLFRFENDQAGRDPETPAEFTTYPRAMALGGDPITDTLDTVWGTLDFVADPGEFGMSNVVDGQQAGHWKDDALSGSYVGLMDPTLTLGTIEVVDEPDLRALDLIGYEIMAAGPNEWNLTTGGSYNDFANWTNQSVPDGVGAVPNFVGSITEARTVTVDSPVTVGTINFNNANSYTIAGPAGITLNASVGDAQINVVQGNHTISAPISVAGGLAVDTDVTTSLTLAPAAGYPVLEGTLTKNGLGTLVVGNNALLVGNVNVNAGVLNAGPGVLANPGEYINLADGATLEASGTINRRVVNVPDDPDVLGPSTLEAVGALAVGVLDDTDGYDYEGKLEVGSYIVGLMDSDLAEVYRGATIGGGTLGSINGIKLQAGSFFAPTIYGPGTIAGHVVFNLSFAAGLPTDKLYFTGVVDGVGGTGNCVFAGLDRRGASPVYNWSAGGNEFLGRLRAEIWGPNAGQARFDKDAMRIVGEADPKGYHQWAISDGTEIGGAPTDTLGGTLLIDVFGWYIPLPGDEFRIFEGSVITGLPPEWGLPGDELPAGNYTGWFDTVVLGRRLTGDWLWRWEYMDHSTDLGPAVGGRPSQDFFLSATLTMVPDLDPSAVPEPGTLVLLVTGGLALLGCAWRRRR